MKHEEQQLLSSCVYAIKDRVRSLLTPYFDRVVLGHVSPHALRGERLAIISSPHQSFEVRASFPRSYLCDTSLVIQLVLPLKTAIDASVDLVSEKVLRLMHESLNFNGLVEGLCLDEIESEIDDTTDRILGLSRLTFKVTHLVEFSASCLNAASFTGGHVALNV